MNKVLATSLKAVLLIFVFLFIGLSINPFDGKYFIYHDQTQPARVLEFFLNLKQLNIPPRLSANMYFNLGYPVFNYYSPSAYLFTSAFMLAGLNSPQAIELSFIVFMLIGFAGMFLLLKQYFSFLPSFLGATAYITTPYLAVEIFVRGNLAELCFWAFLPLTLYLLKTNQLFKASLSTSVLLTAHNVLSLTAVPLLISWVLTNRSKKNLLALVFGFLLSAYFLLPALLEQHLVWAKTIAERTNYQQHFLCLKQLWSNNGWLYGGSIAGCNDSMSFKLGKIQILLLAVGLSYFSYKLIKLKKITAYKDQLAVLFWGVLFTLATLEYSKPVWDQLSTAVAVFQFPWRFLIYSVFALSFFIPYAVHLLKSAKLTFKLTSILLIVLLLIINKKYFKPEKYFNYTDFYNRYLSAEYIKYAVANSIPEYLSKQTKYEKVLLELNKAYKDFLNNKDLIKYNKDPQSTVNVKVINFSNNLFNKNLKVLAVTTTEYQLPIHFINNWKIKVNNKLTSPKKFDDYARPIITLDTGENLIEMQYSQSIIEKTGNIISIISFIMLTLISYKISKNAKQTRS